MNTADIRDALRDLHRALIGAVRSEYERENGPIPGPAELLRLLTEDAYFEWLRPLSRMIVEFDAEQTVSRAAVEALLRPTSSFGQRYAALLQQDPQVAGSHARLRGALKRLELN